MNLIKWYVHIFNNINHNNSHFITPCNLHVIYIKYKVGSKYTWCNFILYYTTQQVFVVLIFWKSYFIVELDYSFNMQPRFRDNLILFTWVLVSSTDKISCHRTRDLGFIPPTPKPSSVCARWYEQSSCSDHHRFSYHNYINFILFLNLIPCTI